MHTLHHWQSLKVLPNYITLSRSGYYRSLLPRRESEANEELMKAIDRQYIRIWFYGSRRMAVWLKNQGYAVTRIL